MTDNCNEISSKYMSILLANDSNFMSLGSVYFDWPSSLFHIY